MSDPARFKKIITSVLLVIASINLVRTTRDIIKSSKRLDSLQEEVAGLKSKEAVLEQDLAYKQSNEFVEESARNNLNMTKEGEKVYVVLDSKEKESVLGQFTKKIEGNNVIKDSNLYSWYKLFLD